MRIQKLLTTSPVIASLVFVVGTSSADRPAAEPPQSQAVACDQQCLSKVMDDFLRAMLAGKPGTVPLAEHAEIRENAVVVPLDATSWRRVKLPNQPRMYVSEVFKVVSGRIVQIDNIGLMMQGVNTLGFAH